MGVINTYIGKQDIDLVNPDPRTILLCDILYVMRREGRYANHTPLPWSVLRHSILAAIIAQALKYSADICRACLWHDASEAYTGDIAKPIKDMIWPLFGPIEQRLEYAILLAMNLPVWFSPYLSNSLKDTVKWVDYLAYHGEVRLQRLRCPIQELDEETQNIVDDCTAKVSIMTTEDLIDYWHILDYQFESHAQ